MARKLLSEQFREQLQGLGSNLASHTRSLEDHFASQEAFLAVRHQELEEVAKEALPASPEVEDALEIALVPLVNGDLNQLTVPELKRLCNGAGLKGYSKFKKPQLVLLLKAFGITAPPVQVKKLSRSQLEAIVNALLATSGRC